MLCRQRVRWLQKKVSQVDHILRLSYSTAHFCVQHNVNTNNKMLCCCRVKVREQLRKKAVKEREMSCQHRNTSHMCWRMCQQHIKLEEFFHPQLFSPFLPLPGKMLSWSIHQNCEKKLYEIHKRAIEDNAWDFLWIKIQYPETMISYQSIRLLGAISFTKKVHATRFHIYRVHISQRLKIHVKYFFLFFLCRHISNWSDRNHLSMSTNFCFSDA